MPSPDRFPLFVDLGGREVLVVGAGPVGAGKARSLIEAGARVRIVATRVGPEARALGCPIAERAFEDADVDGAFLVVSATGDPEAQRLVFAAAEARRRFVLAVDDPANGSASGGSVIARPPFVIAISSGGETPALTRLLRHVLEAALPPERWVERARALRRRWKERGTPIAERFDELLAEVRRSDR